MGSKKGLRPLAGAIVQSLYRYSLVTTNLALTAALIALSGCGGGGSDNLATNSANLGIKNPVTLQADSLSLLLSTQIDNSGGKSNRIFSATLNTSPTSEAEWRAILGDSFLLQMSNPQFGQQSFVMQYQAAAAGAESGSYVLVPVSLSDQQVAGLYGSTIRLTMANEQFTSTSLMPATATNNSVTVVTPAAFIDLTVNQPNVRARTILATCSLTNPKDQLGISWSRAITSALGVNLIFGDNGATAYTTTVTDNGYWSANKSSPFWGTIFSASDRAAADDPTPDAFGNKYSLIDEIVALQMTRSAIPASPVSISSKNRDRSHDLRFSMYSVLKYEGYPVRYQGGCP